MKTLWTMLLLGIFGLTIAGCEGEAEIGDPGPRNGVEIDIGRD